MGNDIALVHQCMFTFTPTLLRHLATPSLYYRHDPVRWVHDPVPARPYERRNPLRARLDACDPLRAGYFRLLVHEDRLWAVERRCLVEIDLVAGLVAAANPGDARPVPIPEGRATDVETLVDKLVEHADDPIRWPDVPEMNAASTAVVIWALGQR